MISETFSVNYLNFKCKEYDICMNILPTLIKIALQYRNFTTKFNFIKISVESANKKSDISEKA